MPQDNVLLLSVIINCNQIVEHWDASFKPFSSYFLNLILAGSLTELKSLHHAQPSINQYFFEHGLSHSYNILTSLSLIKDKGVCGLLSSHTNRNPIQGEHIQYFFDNKIKNLLSTPSFQSKTASRKASLTIADTPGLHQRNHP